MTNQTKDIIKDIEKKLFLMSEIIEDTKSYWAGDAADALRAGFLEQKSEMEEVLTRIKDHPEVD